MQKVLILPAEFSEVRRASAEKGTSLSTTLALISLPFGSDWIGITARDFVSCAVAEFALNPYLTIVTTTNLLTGTSVTGGAGITAAVNCDISKEMQDGDATNFAIDSIPTASNGGYIYVGSPLPFRGVAVDVGTDVNDTASVLTVNYWNGAWTDTSATDGTIDSGSGKSMQIDGSVTWTVQSTWEKASLIEIGDTVLKTKWSGPNLYWTRWEWDAALDSTDIVQMRPLNRSTNYAELIEGQAFEHTVRTSATSEAISCVEALTDAGTAKLVVNVATVTTAGLSSRERFE